MTLKKQKWYPKNLHVNNDDYSDSIKDINTDEIYILDSILYINLMFVDNSGDLDNSDYSN